MGIVQKVNDWWSEKSDQFARGGDANRSAAGAYYASPEAEQAYGGMRAPAQNASATADAQSAGAATGRVTPVDRFSGDPNDKYSGRVPYRSQKDLQAEAENQRQQLEDQARRQQGAGQARGAAQPFARTAAQPGQPVYQQPQAAQQPGNVLQFPGMIRGPEGNLYAHVEYVVLLRSRNECTKVIEYIKANASVFLNMEFIANDSERQRCVDMLSGAAYTLGCHLNKISQRGIYLISSPSVCVVIDPAMQKYASAPEAQGYVRPEYAAYPSGYGAGAQPSPYAAKPQAAYASGEQAVGYGAGEAGYGARATGYRTQAASAGYGARAASPADYGAQAASASGYGAQPANAGYGAQSASTSGYGARTAGAGYGAQPAAATGYGAQRAGGYGAQTGSFAAQTGAFAAPAAAAVGYGAQTGAYAAQHPGYGSGAPTGGYAPVAPQAQARRAGAPFAMQSAFTRNADSGTARP